MYRFVAKIGIIGINPFVLLPERVLEALFRKSGKQTSPIRVKGSIAGKPYKQSLVKFKGEWRLYINMSMLPNSPKRIGEEIEVTIDYDFEERSEQANPALMAALEKNIRAKKKFDSLPPYLQNEMSRYITKLKSEESIDRNIRRAIDYLLGKASFSGRKPLK